VYGKGCTTCGTSVYDYTASSSYAPTGRNLTITYGSGTATGPEAKEQIAPGGIAQLATYGEFQSRTCQ
jgi:hypothetical protein